MTLTTRGQSVPVASGPVQGGQVRMIKALGDNALGGGGSTWMDASSPIASSMNVYTLLGDGMQGGEAEFLT